MDGCVCWVSGYELWSEVWWLSDEARSSRKTLIPKLLAVLWCQECIAAEGRTRDAGKVREGRVWGIADFMHMLCELPWANILSTVARWWNVAKQEDLKNNRKMRERACLSKSRIQEHYSGTGQMSWSWFGVNVLKTAGEAWQQTWSNGQQFCDWASSGAHIIEKKASF